MHRDIGRNFFSLESSILQMMEHTKATQMPQSFQAQVLLALTYFLNQARCHADRRDPPQKIRGNWIDLDTLVLGTSLFDKFKADKPNWEALQEALGIIPIRPPLPPKPARERKNRFEGYNVEELLTHLARKAEIYPHFSKPVRYVVCLGLFYLELEARRGRAQRNHDRINFTWRLIHPFLKRASLLDEFEGNAEVRRKFKFFILNKIV